MEKRQQQPQQNAGELLERIARAAEVTAVHAHRTAKFARGIDFGIWVVAILLLLILVFRR